MSIIKKIPYEPMPLCDGCPCLTFDPLKGKPCVAEIAALKAEVERLKAGPCGAESEPCGECVTDEIVALRAEVERRTAAYDSQEQSFMAMQASYLQEFSDQKMEISMLKAALAAAEKEFAFVRTSYDMLKSDKERTENGLHMRISDLTLVLTALRDENREPILAHAAAESELITLRSQRDEAVASAEKAEEERDEARRRLCVCAIGADDDYALDNFADSVIREARKWAREKWGAAEAERLFPEGGTK